MSLAELQQKFQAAVLSGETDPSLLAVLAKPPRGQTANERFAIYSDGYRLRHAEFLANDFPTLREAVGDEIFGAMVEAYIAAKPSHFRNARWYGAGLPDFLAVTAPFCHDAFACALARLEGALAKAFDAEDTESLALDALSATPMDMWPELRFRPHPSAHLIDSSEAAMETYAAICHERAPEIEADGESRDILIWRQALEVRYRALSPLEALALRELFAGSSFGEICGLLAFAAPEEQADDLTAQAADFLANWFAEGLMAQVFTQGA